MSLAALRLLAEMFVPMVARMKLNDAKKAAARLSHLSMRRSGSQRISPYKLFSRRCYRNSCVWLNIRVNNSLVEPNLRIL